MIARRNIFPTKYFGVRHGQYVLLFSAILVAYTIRIAFNVAVIAITSNQPVEGVPTYPEWANQKNVMLSSFFWGYIPPQLVAGQMAKNYGAKRCLATTTFLVSLFSLLIPVFAAEFGYEGVIVCRVLQGLGQGFLFPCIHTLISKWTAAGDRAKVGAFTYAGVPLGTLISMPATGLLSKWEYVGWPVSFYLFGATGMAWSLMFAILGSESPSVHGSVSAEEVSYIESGSHPDKNLKKIPTPWKSILTSLPVWAILICHSGENWGFWSLLTEIPSFFDKIMHFDIAANSFLSALPYLVFWFLCFCMGPMADLLITKKIARIVTSRKIFTAIAMYTPVITLFSINYVDIDQTYLFIFLLVMSVGATAGVFSGYNVNHIDLAPNHAGALMGLATMFGNIFALLAPLSVDLIIYISGYSETDKELWAIVFYTASAIYLVTGTFYMLCASGEVQLWNAPKEKEKSDDVVHIPSDISKSP